MKKLLIFIAAALCLTVSCTKEDSSDVSLEGNKIILEGNWIILDEENSLAPMLDLYMQFDGYGNIKYFEAVDVDKCTYKNRVLTGPYVFDGWDDVYELDGSFITLDGSTFKMVQIGAHRIKLQDVEEPGYAEYLEKVQSVKNTYKK